MPPRRLPNLPLPREPLPGGWRRLTPEQEQLRDSALDELRAAVELEDLAQRRTLVDVRAALEAGATLAAVARVMGTSEAAMSMWLRRSRRRSAAAVTVGS